MAEIGLALVVASLVAVVATLFWFAWLLYDERKFWRWYRDRRAE